MPAVIFDMDGVLVDSMPYHIEAYKKVLGEVGIKIDADFIKRRSGMRAEQIIAEALGKEADEETEELAGKKEDIFRELAKNIVLMDGADELLENLKMNDFKLAIATGTRKENAEMITQLTEIRNFFDVIISADDVERVKPDPEPLLTAAEALNETPETCIMIGDAVNDMLAAKNAGMKVIILLSGTVKREEVKGADLIIKSLRELKAEDIKRLLDK